MYKVIRPEPSMSYAILNQAWLPTVVLMADLLLSAALRLLLGHPVVSKDSLSKEGFRGTSGGDYLPVAVVRSSPA